LVNDALAEADLEVDYLELEITESLLMENPQAASEMLNRLRKRGVRLSIDDFGTGYSSLCYLKQFALDKLKIDRTFVRDVVTNPDDSAIITAIIAMANQLKLRVVAEGVETEDQLRFLMKHGCDKVQGYFFSKPLPSAECIQFLENHRCFKLSEG
jgi:EAL domain-containing protein (putative c-di-GMP-specific phosphodiesterase class I)